MRLFTLGKASLLSVALTGVAGGVAMAQNLKTDKDKISYMIGHQIGSNFKRDGLEVDLNVLQAAMKDALAGKKSPLTQEETQKLMQNLQKELAAKAEAKAKAEGEKNTTAGKKFLDDNKKKDGVKVTATGLQYKVLKEGTGEAPKPTDTVKVNYRGTLIDGTEFDSSYKRGQPAQFPVNGVIKGWTEALQLMKPGAKYALVIPSDLAYGERGAGELIGPNSVLQFEVELLSVEKAPPPPPDAAPTK